MDINSKTKLVGLLGYPLGHTFSPAMQNAAFKHDGANFLYIPIETKPENLETIVKATRCMNFAGFNVTIPYKVEIMKYIDEIDDLAKSIGAVNTVAIKEGRLKGYNTDGRGFLRSIEQQGLNIKGKRVFVLGSGGASRAICMTLALEGAKNIFICNRTHEKAVALSQAVNKQVPNSSSVIPMNRCEMENALNNTDILINTTSVGMYPHVEEYPIDVNLLNKNIIVCDIVYNPKKTKLLQEAEKIGCTTISGTGMIVYQGAEAYELWTDNKAPVDMMFDVLDRIKE